MIQENRNAANLKSTRTITPRSNRRGTRRHHQGHRPKRRPDRRSRARARAVRDARATDLPPEWHRCMNAHSVGVRNPHCSCEGAHRGRGTVEIMPSPKVRGARNHGRGADDVGKVESQGVKAVRQQSRGRAVLNGAHSRQQDQLRTVREHGMTGQWQQSRRRSPQSSGPGPGPRRMRRKERR